MNKSIYWQLIIYKQEIASFLAMTAPIQVLAITLSMNLKVGLIGIYYFTLNPFRVPEQLGFSSHRLHLWLFKFNPFGIARAYCTNFNISY